MTTKGSNNPFPSVLLNEVATDGSDTPTPAADYRRLFLGEDGGLHLIDSADVVTDVGGSVAELDDVGDVNAPTPSNGDVLTWDSTPGEWVAAAPSGGGNVATDAIWDAAGDLALGTGANTAAKLAIGSSGHVLTSNGTTAAWSAPSASPILATLRYAPGSNTSIATTTSATQSDVDATNAKVTAVVPASGSVMIRMACAITTTSNQNAFFGIRQGSTDLAGPTLVTSDNNLNVIQRWFVLTGLTPGSQDFKAAFSVAGGATLTLYGGPTSGPIEMDVWAL